MKIRICVMMVSKSSISDCMLCDLKSEISLEGIFRVILFVASVLFVQVQICMRDSGAWKHRLQVSESYMCGILACRKDRVGRV